MTDPEREAERLAFETRLSATPCGDRPDRDADAPLYPRTPAMRRNRHEPAECQPEGATCQPAVIARPWRPLYVRPVPPPGETLEAMLQRLHDAPPPPTQRLAYAYPGRPMRLYVPPEVREVPAGAWMREVMKRGG